MHAFFSFHHEDRKPAGEVRMFFRDLGITSFLAHEDIDVSLEWQEKILEELGNADIFVAILSAKYHASAYCLQESGIAIFKRMTIVPLAIDNSIPPGFLRHIQSRRIEPGKIDQSILLAGIAKHDPAFVIGIQTKKIGRSGDYRSAEGNFEEIVPFLNRATPEQAVRLLNVASENGQVCFAHLVGQDYLPPLLAKYGHLLDEHTRKRLQERVDYYAGQ